MLALALVLVLSGTVHGPDGSPIAGARIVVSDAARTTATTDQAGKFSVSDVTLPVTIEVSAKGFATLRVTVVESPVDIALSPAVVVESIIVTPDPADGTWRDANSGTTKLSQSDVQKIPAVTPDETIRVVSGFSLFRRSTSRASNPTTHGVTMRGLSASGASRAAILLDGVPLNDGFGGWVTWTRLPTDAIAQIEIERGAAADAYGSDALGGAIRVTGQTGQRSSATVGAETGSYGISSVDAAGGVPVGRVSMYGATSWFQTDGAIPVAPELQGPVDRPGDADWYNAFGRMAFGDANRRLTVTGWGGRDDRGNGTVLQRNRMSGGTGAVSYEAVGQRSVLTARVSFSPNTFYQTFTTVTTVAGVPRAGETLTSTQNTDTNATRLFGEYGRNLPNAHVLVRGVVTRTGGTFEDAKPTTTISRSLRDDSEAVAVQAGFTPAGALTVSAGMRSEWRAAPTDADTRDTATVGHVSGAWHPDGLVTVRGSFATSHRWPTLNELVRDFQAGNVLTQANPALRPERGHSADGALALDSRHWLASVGYYWAVVDDAIANVTISNTLRQRRNTGEAHAHGVELDGEVRPWTFARLRASATYADATFLNSIEAPLEGKRLPQVPRWSGTIAGDVTFKSWIGASAVWHGVSTQFDDDLNRFQLLEAYQLDLQLGGKVGPIHWHLDADNALDARIETGRSGNPAAPLITIAPGRTIRFGVSWRK